MQQNGNNIDKFCCNVKVNYFGKLATDQVPAVREAFLERAEKLRDKTFENTDQRHNECEQDAAELHQQVVVGFHWFNHLLRMPEPCSLPPMKWAAPG